MSIRFECFGCGRIVNVRDSMAGKRIRCPDCSANLVVPLEQSVESDIPRQRPPSDPPKRKPQKPDPPRDHIDVRPSGVMEDSERVQPIGMFTDRETFASRPGRFLINPFQYWYCFPFWPTVLIIGTVTFSVPVVTVHYSWLAVAVLFGLATILYWVQIADYFRCGCLCPAVVVSPERQLVAVYTDLGSNHESYPAVRVIRQPMRRMKGGMPPKGTRLAAVALYARGKSTEHWETFNPTIVNCATRNESKIARAMKSIPQDEWDALLNAVETISPTRKTLIKLW